MNSLYKSNAAPRQSNPGPKLAVVEGTVLDVNKIHFILAKQPNINLIIEDIKKLLAEYKNKTDDHVLNDFNDYWKKYAVANGFDTKEVIFVKRILQNALPKIIRSKFFIS